MVCIGNTWVFCEEGNVSKAIDPYRNFPILGFQNVNNDTLRCWHDVPKGVDLLYYATDVLNIDPLLIVFDIKDFEPKGVHRYGYAMLDYRNRQIILTTTKNGEGFMNDAWWIRRGMFLLKEKREEREPKEFSIGEEPLRNDPGDLYYKVEELLAKPSPDVSTDPLVRFARCRDVDFKRTLKYWKDFLKADDTPKTLMDLFTPAYLRNVGYGEIKHLGVDLMRDLLFLPVAIIDQDGYSSFLKERVELIAKQEWTQLKHHLKQCKERIIKKHFSTGVPGEEYVACMRCDIGDQ